MNGAAVRPDGLTTEEEVTDYEIHPSPIRSAIFNAGKTSRINVGHFMADPIHDNELWTKGKGQMPVIYKIRRCNKNYIVPAPLGHGSSVLVTNKIISRLETG